MFKLFCGTKSKHCDGVSRRSFLQVGTLGALGLSLPTYFQQQAQAKKGARAKSVVLVYLGGGLSHHDSFDLKPEAAAEIRGNYQQIHTNVSGLQIGEKLPLMARVMDKVALVRSGAHNNDHHETATNWVLCGKFGSAFGDYPAMGAVVAHELGFAGKLPPYVSIPRNPSFTWELGRSAFLGGRFESFKTGDPNAQNFKVRDVSPGENLDDDSLIRRQTLLQAVDGLARRVQGNDQVETYDEFQKRAASLVLSAESRSAFAIEQETDKLRDGYGRTSFGQSCLLARRLVERGVRFVTVSHGGWDHHAKIFPGLDSKLPEFDRAMSSLLTDMAERGLLDDTLVLVMGEFGRTPIINKDAGRDHWGPAGCLLFAGAGVKGANVIGATDRNGAYVTRRPVTPADVAHTVYEALGIDPAKMLLTPDGRPIEILDKGETVKELYS